MPLFIQYRPALPALALCLTAHGASADVFVYGVGRSVTYTQTSVAQPIAPEYWGFSAVVYADVEWEVLSGEVSFDQPPPVSYPLIIAHPNLSSYYSMFYTDEPSHLADYPATTYTLSIDRGGGPESADVYLAADLYCPEVPYFTGDTYDRMQSIDPSVAFD